MLVPMVVLDRSDGCARSDGCVRSFRRLCVVFGQVCGAFEQLQQRLFYNLEHRLFVRSPIVTLLVLLAIALGVMAEVQTSKVHTNRTNRM